MFVEESVWIRAALNRLELAPGSRVLDVGSSTSRTREELQPWIDENVFLPLRERGCSVAHLDVFEDEGVDIVCDITDPRVNPVECIGGQYDLVISCSMLTEVTDPVFAAQRLTEIVCSDGHLLVSVPCRYRKYGPGDRMLRLSVKGLHTLFSSSATRPLTSQAAGVIRIDDRRRYRAESSRNPVRRWQGPLRYRIKPLRWRVSCVAYQVL